MLTATHLVFFVEIQVSLDFPCSFQHMPCVDFTENTLFNSSGDIYWSPLPSSLLGQLLMDKRDSDGFFSSRLVCRTSDSSYNSTDSSLVTIDYQQSFMASDFFVCNKTANHVRHTRTHAWHVMSSRAIAQLAFLWLLQMSRAKFAQHCSLEPEHNTITLLHNTVYVHMYSLDSQQARRGFCTIVLHYVRWTPAIKWTIISVLITSVSIDCNTLKNPLNSRHSAILYTGHKHFLFGSSSAQ